MHVYLSLKQILLNQIAVLLRQKYQRPDADQDRLNKRLLHLQKALEQIKSYSHNKNFQFVIRHFNIALDDKEIQILSDLSSRFGDQNDNNNRSKTGFTTTRSETLFTGAEPDQYDNLITGGDSDDDDNDDHKYNTSGYGNINKKSKKKHQQIKQTVSPSQWIMYRGFAYWLKKQSFIKLKHKKDAQKYKKIWNTIIGLNLVNGWKNGNIGSQNIIGAYGTTQPYIAIHKSGSKEIVKASLLRISMTQNRIFKFNIDKYPDDNKYTSSHRARGSIDLDNDDNGSDNYFGDNANELIKGKNLFDKVLNKDVLRIVATMLWDTNLANNVLEELLHNPRFSMYGIHARNIADTIAKEMNLDKKKSSSYSKYTDNDDYDNDMKQQTNKNTNANKPGGGGGGGVSQFALPSPQRPVTMSQQKKKAKNNYGVFDNDNSNVNNASYTTNKGDVAQFPINPNFNTKDKDKNPNKNTNDAQQTYQYQQSYQQQYIQHQPTAQQQQYYQQQYMQQQQQYMQQQQAQYQAQQAQQAATTAQQGQSSQMSDHEKYYLEQQKLAKNKKSTPPIQEEQDVVQDWTGDIDNTINKLNTNKLPAKPTHNPKSGSVVEHDFPMDHINASQIPDGQQDYDNDSDSSSGDYDHDDKLRIQYK